MFLEDFPPLFPYEISCNFVCSKKNGIPGMWVPVHVPVEFLRSFSSRRVRHIHVMMCNTATIIWYASDQRKIPSLRDDDMHLWWVTFGGIQHSARCSRWNQIKLAQRSWVWKTPIFFWPSKFTIKFVFPFFYFKDSQFHPGHILKFIFLTTSIF